jgi:hypothetical protein
LKQALEAFPIDDSTPRQPLPEEAAPAPQARRATDARFAVESTTADHPALQIVEARDLHLGRPVTLVRVAPGDRREPILGLIRAAARGDEHLQRVLALDLDRGHAVLQSIEALDHAPPPLTRAAVLRRCEQLANALEPLHEAGVGHGAITTRALAGNDEQQVLVLALVPAILARAGEAASPDPASDITAVLALYGLEPARRLDDAPALRHWAASELAREAHALRAQRQQALLEQALAQAPDGLDRRGPSAVDEGQS